MPRSVGVPRRRRPRRVDAGRPLGRVPARRAASAAPPRRTRSPPTSPSTASVGSAADALGRQVGAAPRDRHGERACPGRRAARPTPSPPCSFTSSCTSARPMPDALVRARARALDAVEALEDVRQLLLAGSRPVSRDRQLDACRRACRSATAIAPSNVNLNAFESRLRTIFSHMSRSTKTGSASGGQSTRSSSPARLDRRAEGARQLRGQRGQIGRLGRRPARGRPRCARSRAAC